MKLKDQHQHLLFPTPIWQTRFEDCDELNDRLYRDVLAFDWDAYKKEHALSFGDDLTSRNEDTFIPIDRVPGIMTVLKSALDQARVAAEQYGWDLDSKQLQVEQFWANVNGPHEFNMQHNHAPNHISGVYYVRVPDGSGDIRFHDERRLRTVTEPNAVRDSPLAYTSYTFQPAAGMLLLFPGWLDHVVGQNKSGEVRVSISFNIDLVKPKAS